MCARSASFTSAGRDCLDGLVVEAAHELFGLGERALVVENAREERGDRGRELEALRVAAANLDRVLQARFGKECVQVQATIPDGRAFAFEAVGPRNHGMSGPC